MVETYDDEPTTALPVGYGANASLAVSLARAEVDQQIATARSMPRSIKKAVSNIMTLATLDGESAVECIYALPRDGKTLRGPSVRFAEIISSQWGNCRVGARVVHVDRIDKYVEAEGVFHDLETNMAATARVRRRISTSKGKLFSDDMIIVTGNAACAIAKRNAILGGVPKGVWRQAYSEVEKVLIGNVKTLKERREIAFKAFAMIGVKPEQIFAALGVAGEDDINLEHMATLTAMRSALKNDEATIEELFPVQQAQGVTPVGTTAKLDALAAGKKEEKAEDKALPPHDPQTGEILEPQTKPATVDEKESPATQQSDLLGQQKPKQQPARDPQTQALFEAGKVAARKGSDALNDWHASLAIPDLERIDPLMDDLRMIAEDYDAR